MRSDLDESDLYPPDAEDHELTTDAKNHRMRAAVGATLLTWGVSLLLQRAMGIDIDTFVLGLGLGALAGWSQVRRYLWFAVGAIATGFGAAEVAGAVVDGAFGSTLALLLIAAGFAAVYVRYPRRSTWALVPAGIMALFAAGAFGVGLIGLLPAMLGRFLLPLLLVGGGALLLFRHSLPPRTVKVGLAAVAVTFVLVGANSVPDLDQRPEVGLNVGPLNPATSTYGLPALEGRTLVLEGERGDVTFEPAADGQARIVSTQEDRRPPFGFGFDVDDSDDDQIVVSTLRDGRPFSGTERDLIVYLPEGAEVEVERTSGAIAGRIVGGRGTFETTSGPIRLRIDEGGNEGYGDDGPHDVRTDSGPIRIESGAPLVLDVMTDSGQIRVDGEVVDDDDFESDDDARGIELEIDSDSGDIRVDGSSPSSSTSSSSSSSTPLPTAPEVPATPPTPATPPAPASPSD